MTDEEKVPVGKCPVHGVVTDDDVNFNFPAPATCEKCGHELTVVGLETPSKIQQATA